MRILFGVHSYKPAYKVGGPIHSVSAVAEGLAARGHCVTVFTSNWNLTEPLDVPLSAPQDVNGVEVYYFGVMNPLVRLFPNWTPAARLSNYNFIPDIHQVLERRIASFDIAHTHLPFIYPTLAIGRSALKAGVPLCYHQRGVFDPARLNYKAGKKRLYMNLIERSILSGADRLFALTEAEAASYRGLGLTNQIEVVPNGVDIDTFSGPSEPSSVRKLGIDHDDEIVLFLGRLHPIKGIDALVDGFLSIAASFPHAKLVLAGPDELKQAPSWRARARRAGMEDRLLVPGMVSGADKKALLSRANIFCLPSAAEGFSMAILEAMASSTAILISPGCHFTEAVDAGAGVMVATDAKAVGDGLAGLLANPIRTAEMGRRGRVLVETKFQWTHIIDQFEAIYQDVVEDQRRR